MQRSDYKKQGGDVAGNLDKENNAVKNGGKLIFTSGKMHSSTELLNSNFDEFNPTKKLLKLFQKK